MGYIGSFTSLALLEAGYEVIIVDNLYNAYEEVLNRIELLSGRRPSFYNADITKEEDLDKVFAAHPGIQSVIHFAALKAVGESSQIPTEYYRTNVYGTICLLRAMTRHNVTEIVFSSSATVYGDATRFENMIPIPEICPLGPTNPYGRTKYVVEMLIEDHVNAERTKAASTPGAKQWNAAFLRYFNPAGAHPSGIMGEDPQGTPNNLLPLLGHVAIGIRDKLKVYGSDYDSKDGTPIRDYIHILDLAQGHLAALNYIRSHHDLGVRAWNLGTGVGSTVLEIIKAFSDAVGKEMPYEVVDRRAGDVLDLTANPTRANTELNWKALKTPEEACVDLWKWVGHNPKGYRQSPPAELVAKIKESKA
jgi:UDP-glucose 4-epimerase